MSDRSHTSEDQIEDDGDSLAGGKRRADARKVRHTVLRVVVATLTTVALVTGVTVTYLYRHLNSNLHVEDITGAVNIDPVKAKAKFPAGPDGAINILVMGSDNRDAPGDHIDNLTGIGKRSDTTILLHISADRKRAYGVSIPRDTVVNRPACLDNNSKPISAPATGVLWNDAFNVGGPACTIRQFFEITHIVPDHWIMVDFGGFTSMVDAIGGVEVCLPHAVNDTIGHITLPAGTHRFSGKDALDYVRERHSLGNGGDIDRTKRQQAFIASMVNQLVSANTLANPLHLTRFLNAATKSLHLDEGLGSLTKLAGLGGQLRHIGLSKIKFITAPWDVDPNDPNRVVFKPIARTLWTDLREDKPLPKALLSGALNAHHIPGVTHHKSKNAAANLATGLCA